MKAAQISGYGGESVVQVNNVDKPTIGKNELLIEVQAASINPFDWKIRDGLMKSFIKLNFPATLGGDLAGTVAAIGEDVTGFKIGQEVYGMANAAGGLGSFAEFSPVKANKIALKLTSIDFKTAAAYPLAAGTAYDALQGQIYLKEGQKILIHGGGGGIGSMAIQIAKLIGAYVATTVSEKDIDYVKNLGADEIIDYGKEDFTLKIKDYDAVFDIVGGETNKKSYEVVKDGGVIVSMIQAENPELVEMRKVKYVHMMSNVNSDTLQKLNELIGSNKIKVNIDKTYNLDQAGESLEYQKTGHPKGKVILEIKNNA